MSTRRESSYGNPAGTTALKSSSRERRSKAMTLDRERLRKLKLASAAIADAIAALERLQELGVRVGDTLLAVKAPSPARSPRKA